MKLPAYFIVPVIFTLLGYLVIRVAFSPVINRASVYASLVTADEAPNFNKDLKVIYDPDAAKYTDTVSEEDPGETSGSGQKPGQTIPISAVTYPEVGDMYGKLTSEKLGLNAPVYWGDTNTILRSGAGQETHTFLPGFGRLIVLSAHNISFFNPLKNAEAGDIIVFDTNYERYEYKVTKVEISKADDLKTVVKSKLLEDKETLILYTCYPFDAVVAVPDRYVVYCERVKGLDVKWRY